MLFHPVKKYNLHTARTYLSQLIQKALEGERIVIVNNGEPQVILTPYQSKFNRKPGAWKGKVEIADDFDELPKGIETAFLGELE